MSTPMEKGISPRRGAPGWGSPYRAKTRSRGQALIFGLVFSAAGALIVLMLFNSAILTTTKSQLQNAADAGAYSAAVLQARDANFSAYTNRAMIANQVAVAQFVSLKSYLEDANETHKRMKSWLHTAYRVIPSFAPAWDAAKSVPIPAAYSAINGMAGPAVKALDLLIDAMDQAQQIHHLGTMAEMMLVADDVVKKNDPLAKVTTSAFMIGDAAVRVKSWGDSTQRFSANDASKEADRFADIVVHKNTTDLFIRNRVSIPTAAWASNVKPYLCPGAVATSTVFGFAHFGGTLLSSNKRRWLGLDATQGGGFASCTWLVPCFPTGVCPVTVTLPLPDATATPAFLGGHGGAVAGAGGKYNDGKGYKNNPSESWLYGWALASPAVVPANYRYWVKGPGTTLDSNGGLQDHYRDMADPTNPANKPKNQTALENGGKFHVTLEVERVGDSVRTTKKLQKDAKLMALPEEFKGNTMRALSSAHAYFYRSNVDSSRFTRNGWRRGDNRTEYQNLFSPYWQARLAPTPAVEEAAAAAAQ